MVYAVSAPMFVATRERPNGSSRSRWWLLHRTRFFPRSGRVWRQWLLKRPFTWSQPTGESALATYGLALAGVGYVAPGQQDWPPPGPQTPPHTPPPAGGLVTSPREREKELV
jgi:hypothetical protein